MKKEFEVKKLRENLYNIIQKSELVKGLVALQIKEDIYYISEKPLSLKDIKMIDKKQLVWYPAKEVLV